MLNIKDFLQQIKIKNTTGEYLLKLSRQALEYYFIHNRLLQPSEIELPKDDKIYSELQAKRATFVTLNKKESLRGYSLRGCIGHLIAINPLYIDVLQNTYAAAFEDPRFPPLQEHELKDIRIEISILTPQIKLPYSSPNELLDFLQKNKPGVVLNLYGRQATFLPQVWEDLPKPELFLSNLCLKAGLNPDCWLNSKPEIFIYFAQKIEEEE